MDSNFVHSLIRRDLYELLHQITVPQTAGNYVVNIPLLLLLCLFLAVTVNWLLLQELRFPLQVLRLLT